ncbi:EmrB/QacA subfamily drug resistance transporter [Asanoa ferruginea]|uniref:EmrB/QacA subfamily drug resistance transporter n=1 Tax=Asanoa ferruginea TaxID=53367 RepID=A0A3D9ZTN7_9ACTN|nr:MFS transporter [Asanoa ferruginea]REF99822.1 EmrB/QacA subfamily drug resistance transporter [Asanoa ferruginea]GIF51840.1 MFS transporter [Asanoa ferruginea]
MAATAERGAAVNAARAPHARAMLVLAICCCSIFIVGLDTSALNVALPSIQQDLGATLQGAQWTLDAYLLVLASFLILSASVADRVGRRRVFQIGLVTFALGSLLCALAPNLGWLIAFRVLQAIGGSMLNPVAISIISNTFTESRARARAIGVWGGTVGVSVAVGPLLGGVLVEAFSWRAIFLINVPIAIAGFILAGMFIRESAATTRHRLDPVGQVLLVAGVASLTYGIIEVPMKGWMSPQILGSFSTTVASFALLVWWELRNPQPLIDLRFFRSPPFSGATAIALLAFTAQGGFLLLNTLYLQDVLNFSPLGAGLAILPMAALIAVFGPISGRVVARHGPRPSLVIGGVATLAAGLITVIPRSDPSYMRLFIMYALIGIGLGWTNAAITNTAVSGMPNRQAGVAAGIASTMRQLGQALGVAIIGSIIAGQVTEVAQTPAFMRAYHVSWAVIAAIGLANLILGVVTTSARAVRSAQENTDRMGAAARD